MSTRIGKICPFMLWLCFLLVFSSESINGEDVTVSSGELAYFPCSLDGVYGIPRWKIDNTTMTISYHHNELPVDHWFNQTGLIVLADPSKNGWTYSCLLVQFINGGDIAQQKGPFLLTVTEGTNASPINVQRGPHVFEMHTIIAPDSIWTASWQNMPMTEGSYKLRYFACDSQTSLPEITISPSCVNTTVAGLGSIGNQLLEVQVCSSDNVCGFQPPSIATPGTIEPQNVVGVNYGNNDSLPTETPIILAHQPGNSYCFFTSKLTSICDITAIYFDVFSNTGVHHTYSAMQLINPSSAIPFRITIFEGTTNFQLCMGGPMHPIDTQFGSASQVNIQERCLLRPCLARNNLFVSYYGRRAIIQINNPQVSSTAGCSYSLNTMADATSSPIPATSTPIPNSSSTVLAVTSSEPTMMTTSLSQQSSSSKILIVTPVPSTPVTTGSLASPGAIAGIVAIILVLLGTAILYIIFGVIGSIYWRRKKSQKWNPDCEGDSWSTNNSTTASTVASSRNLNDKYWTDA